MVAPQVLVFSGAGGWGMGGGKGRSRWWSVKGFPLTEWPWLGIETCWNFFSLQRTFGQNLLNQAASRTGVSSFRLVLNTWPDSAALRGDLGKDVLLVKITALSQDNTYHYTVPRRK